MTEQEWRRYPRGFRARFSRLYVSRIPQVRAAPLAMIARPSCRWCAVLLLPHTATIDHVHPLGLGGPDALCNVVPCCANCNKVRSKETAWMVHCMTALERYWAALESGAAPAAASAAACNSNGLRRPCGKSSSTRGAAFVNSILERLAS